MSEFIRLQANGVDAYPDASTENTYRSNGTSVESALLALESNVNTLGGVAGEAKTLAEQNSVKIATAEQEISDINSSLVEKLNWTLIGTINASNPTINIPSEYNDIALSVLHSYSEVLARKVYSKITLSTDLEYDLLETRYNIAKPSSSYDINVKISRTQVSLGDNIRSISVYGR